MRPYDDAVHTSLQLEMWAATALCRKTAVESQFSERLHVQRVLPNTEYQQNPHSFMGKC